MKLYLVTSSLNFNNILSSGSVSPKKFYQDRNFGSNIYYEVKDEKLENVLILHKNIPYVSIEMNSKLSQHLVIFEIDKKADELIKINNNIYCFYKTIYFKLDNVKIYFENISDMNKTIKGSIYALETKETLKYVKNIKIIEPSDSKKNNDFTKNKKTLELDNIYDENYIKNELYNDSFFDSVKGIYYGITFNNDQILYSNQSDKYLLLENLQKLMNMNKGDKYFKDILNFAIRQKYKEKNNTLNYIIDIDKEVRRVILNKEILSNFLTKEDIELLKLIYDSIIILNFMTKDRFSNNYVEKLIMNIGENANTEKLKKDIRKIYLGIVKNDINIKYEHIDSIILKNLYLVLLKRKSFKELNSILKTKKVENSFIAYSIYCCILGFTNLSQHITSDIYTNNIRTKYMDEEMTIVQKKITSFYRSEDLYKKQIYELILIYKKVKNYDQILNKYKRLKEFYDIDMTFNNRGDRINIEIKQNNDIFRLTLYTKIYNGKYIEFKKEIERLNIRFKQNSKKFPCFKYYIHDNRTFRELSYKEEKRFLEALNKIGNCLN